MKLIPPKSLHCESVKFTPNTVPLPSGPVLLMQSESAIGAADAADAMNKGAAAPAHNAATLPKARILLAPNTLTSCFEPPQGNAAERTLT